MTNPPNSTSTYILPALGIAGLLLVILLVANNKPSNTPAENWTTNWKTLPSFKYARRALSAVAVDGYLYVIGGVDQAGNYIESVEFSKIQLDGTISNWQSTSALNTGRFYLDAVSSNGYLYALGGGVGELGAENIPVATVERARILADGQLSPWEQLPNMLTPRRGLKTVTIADRIYATGGYNGLFLKSIESARISPSDNVQPSWRLEPHEATVDRYIHSAANHGNYLYVLGGHVQQADKMSYGDIEMTKIKRDGSLNPWHIERSRLLTPRFIASAFTLNHKLYILGGHNGGTRLNSVEFSPIFSDGHIGPWEFTTPLNTSRSATSVAVFNNFIYVLGGMGADGVLNSVEMATQAGNGSLGYLQ